MSTDDRFSIEEFARRYKLAPDQLPAFCELFGVSPDEVVAREEFKEMLDRFEASTEKSPEPQEPQAEAKEAQVAEKKKPFSRLAAERKLTHPRVAVLKVCTGWEDKTKITETELQAAINKHLLNKE